MSTQKSLYTYISAIPELKRLVENNFKLASERTKHKLCLHFLQFWQISLLRENYHYGATQWPILKICNALKGHLIPYSPKTSANLQCRCKLIDKSRRQKHKPLSPLYESREKLRHAETKIYFTCGVRPIVHAICHDDGWAFSTIWLFLIFVNTDLRNDRIWGNGPSRLIFYNALILELKRLNYTGVSN